jgi:hypothetical protein
MKIYSLLIFLFLIFCFYNSQSQVKKVPVRQPHAAKIGPLLIEDYYNYILVERNRRTDNAIIPEFTLKYPEGLLFNSNRYIIMDIRTGKEVAYWPFIDQNFYSIQNKMLYSYDLETLFGFTMTGLPIFKKQLRMQSPPFNGARVSLSSNWKKGVLQTNGDLWIADFNNLDGNLGEFKQATANGVMYGDNTYLKDDVAITTMGVVGKHKGKLINLTSGKFVEIPGSWERANGYITDQFYNIGFGDTGVGYLSPLRFTPLPDFYLFVAWMNEKQTKCIVNVQGQHYVWENKKRTPFPTPILLSVQKHMNSDQGYSSSAEDWIIKPHRMSPEKKNVFYHYSLHDNEGLLIFDLEKLTESRHDFGSGEINSDWLNYSTGWTDDTHLLLSLRPGQKINGAVITTNTQGTYIYDINTKESKRLTAYYVNQINEMMPLEMVTSSKSGYTIFNANNFLFRCKNDGSDLAQLTKTPGLYHLLKPFLDSHPGLE